MMRSIFGVYEDGKIKLSYQNETPFPDGSEVVLTFIDASNWTDDEETDSESSTEENETYYESIREFERVKAYGNITIIVDDTRHTYPLNDYSQGGLSFISDLPFEIGQNVSSGIADPANPDLILMELGMEVRGIFELEEFKDAEMGSRYKVGCMFIDSVDEDLWHGLLQYLS